MNDSIEYMTPKIDGQGDGLKKVTVRKRHPVQSSRKFNARAPRDETLKLKLEKALTEMRSPRRVVQRHSCIQKAYSVAEITPTKNKIRINAKNITTTSNDGSSSDITIFATPRQIDSDLLPPKCSRPKAVCLVYQRTLLCAWRKTKSRLQVQTEVNNQQQKQLSQLELQVEVLNTLRHSESERRYEAINESHNLKLKIEQFESRNESLQNELKDTLDALEDTRASLSLTKEDLKHCTEQLKRVQGQMKKKIEEKMDLVYKLTEQEREIQTKQNEIKTLEENLNTVTMNLQNSDSNNKAKQEEITEALEQLQTEVATNESLREEVDNLKGHYENLEQHSKSLENELHIYITSCDQLRVENLSVRYDLSLVTIELEEEKKKWYQKLALPDMATVSLEILRSFGEVFVPFVMNREVNF